MKKQILTLGLICWSLSASLAANNVFADDAKKPDPIADALTTVDSLSNEAQVPVAAWIAHFNEGRAPEFKKAGLGLGSAAQTTSGGDGGGHTDSLSAAAAFRARAFAKGTMGMNGDDPKDLVAPDRVRGDILARVRQDLYSSFGYNGKALDDAVAVVEKHLDEKMKAYTASYNAAKAAYDGPVDGRPLYFFEGGAQYNLVGKSGSGTFTGGSVNGRGGVGFSFKKLGKSGCDIYFMGVAEGQATGYYKLQSADSSSYAVGLEQGFLCQIAHSVTIMGSPSVQAGKAAHSDREGDMITTDWLEYAARIRAIVDGRLYVSAEGIIHPSMKSSGDSGSHWTANEGSVSLDYALPNSNWIAGADLKTVHFHDENSAYTGQRDVNDTSVGLSLIRAF